MDTTALETPRDWRAIVGDLSLKWTDFVEHGLSHSNTDEVFGQLPSNAKIALELVKFGDGGS